MCIALWYYDSTKFILLFNREEKIVRPTEQLAILDMNELIACGLDRLSQGTWLAIDLKSGVICFLTNREPYNLSLLSFIKHSYTQILKTRAPKLMNLLYSKRESRGKFILTLTQSHKTDKRPINLNTWEEDKMKQIECELDQNQSFSDKALITQAKINSYKYIPYNLFVGSMVDKEFSVYCSLNQKSCTAEQFGSASSLSNIGGRKIKKQLIGEEKFKHIIEHIQDEHKLIEALFSLAKEKFKSDEAFIKEIPGYSSFFVPEFGEGQERSATRTTTLVISIKSKLRVLERTYV